MSKHTFYRHNPSILVPLSIRLTTLHMINGYEICLNTTTSLIFHMQDFHNLCNMWMWCFGFIVFNYITYMIANEAGTDFLTVSMSTPISTLANGICMNGVLLMWIGILYNDVHLLDDIFCELIPWLESWTDTFNERTVVVAYCLCAYE